MMQLTPAQQQLVEANMGLVHKVLADRIHPRAWEQSVYSYEDYRQIGYVGLCKAAASYKPGGKAKFSTVAYVYIRNEIYMAIEYATIRRREITVEEVFASDEHQRFDTPEAMGLDRIVNDAQKMTDGVLRKGITALKLRTQGYTAKEIGERMHAPANHVTAWISRARKYLLSNPAIAELKEL